MQVFLFCADNSTGTVRRTNGWHQQDGDRYFVHCNQRYCLAQYAALANGRAKSGNAFGVRAGRSASRGAQSKRRLPAPNSPISLGSPGDKSNFPFAGSNAQPWGRRDEIVKRRGVRGRRFGLHSRGTFAALRQKSGTSAADVERTILRARSVRHPPTLLLLTTRAA